MTKPFIEGNFEDKYHSTNPVSKWLVRGFLNAFNNLLAHIPPHQIRTVCEVGVGEGELLKHAIKKFPQAKFYATDLSPNQIQTAAENISHQVSFSVQNAENLKLYKKDQFDLVICCEVLEHVNRPQIALKELKRITRSYLLLSVPNEPIWRLLNLARGKYVKDGGNTPGHINHWSPVTFTRFVKSEFPQKSVDQWPFPWQMKLIKVK